MQHDAQKYLVDVFDAARDIAEFSDDLSFEEYQSNKLVKAAVERKFEIIGEAVSRLCKYSPAVAKQIGEHEKIIAFRNLVIHGYDIVSDPIVWDVIQNKLPNLLKDVTHLIDD